MLISHCDRATHQDTAARCSPGTPQASRGTPPGRFSPPAPCTSGVECGILWRSFVNSSTTCPTTTSSHRPPSSPGSSAAPRQGLRRGDKEQSAEEGSVLLLSYQTPFFFTHPCWLSSEPALLPTEIPVLDCNCVCRGVICREGWTGTRHRCLSVLHSTWGSKRDK